MCNNTIPYRCPCFSLEGTCMGKRFRLRCSDCGTLLGLCKPLPDVHGNGAIWSINRKYIWWRILEDNGTYHLLSSDISSLNPYQHFPETKNITTDYPDSLRTQIDTVKHK